jgi:hypothetical protein
VALTVLLVSSCATGVYQTPYETVKKKISAGEAQLIPDSYKVDTAGSNYEISGLYQVGQERIRLYTYAWGTCDSGQGSLYGDTSAGLVGLDNLFVKGGTPADAIFAGLCAYGLPKAVAMVEGLTPQERAERDRRVQASAKAALELMLLQSASRRNKSARDDAGTSVQRVAPQGNGTRSCGARPAAPIGCSVGPCVCAIQRTKTATTTLFASETPPVVEANSLGERVRERSDLIELGTRSGKLPHFYRSGRFWPQRSGRRDALSA